ncbi:hypothetical protein SAY86_000926 [Trapa natans]|uniref:Protein BZR1 homolog n=1 Tax=Trapa natans TaxID=22666 RepID=A0AAN7M4S5_TRANT|nr:hypothetical protein SAY86_000926 [Trapa natans]
MEETSLVAGSGSRAWTPGQSGTCSPATAAGFDQSADIPTSQAISDEFAFGSNNGSVKPWEGERIHEEPASDDLEFTLGSSKTRGHFSNLDTNTKAVVGAPTEEGRETKAGAGEAKDDIPKRLLELEAMTGLVILLHPGMDSGSQCPNLDSTEENEMTAERVLRAYDTTTGNFSGSCKNENLKSDSESVMLVVVKGNSPNLVARKNSKVKEPGTLVFSWKESPSPALQTCLKTINSCGILAMVRPIGYTTFSSDISMVNYKKWKFAERVARDNKKTGIVLRQLTVRNEDELNKLLGSVTIAGEGVLPNIYQTL